MRTLLIAAVSIIAGIIFLADPSGAFAELTLKANHDHIEVDFFYHGSAVTVSGRSEQNADLVIKISSPEGHESFKKKGKAAGLLWMNMGDIEFGNAPGLYFLHSTKDLDKMLGLEDADANVIGYPALERHMDIAPVSDENEKAEWFDEFVKFKESSRLYTVSSGKILLSQKEDGQDFFIKLDWPYEAPPGDYMVSVYGISNGHIIESAETNVHVEQVGVVKLLSNMAKNSGAVYGLISIAIALGAGFGVGLVFRKGGGAH